MKMHSARTHNAQLISISHLLIIHRFERFDSKPNNSICFNNNNKKRLDRQAFVWIGSSVRSHSVKWNAYHRNENIQCHDHKQPTFGWFPFILCRCFCCCMFFLFISFILESLLLFSLFVPINWETGWYVCLLYVCLWCGPLSHCTRTTLINPNHIHRLFIVLYSNLTEKNITNLNTFSDK